MRTLLSLLFVLLFQPLHAVELQEFTADYGVFYGDIELGKATYRFTHAGGGQYRFDFSSELSFLIFSDERVVRSEFTLEDWRLRPSFYSHDRKGTGRDYLEEIHFDPAKNIIRSTYLKESREYPYEDDVVDGLTVQLQLMLDLQRGVEQMKYKIIDFNRIREREFKFAGQETIQLEGVDYPSVIYQVVRDNNKRKTQMWFSTEHNYLPVQMVHFSKGKKKFNAHLVSYREIALTEPSKE